MVNLEITDIFNSDDIDSAKEYCEWKNIAFSYDWNTQTMKFDWKEEDISNIKEMFE
jgi:hypothetical protein